VCWKRLGVQTPGKSLRRCATGSLGGLLLGAAACAALLPAAARAEPSSAQPRNNFGSVGLIEMPSARMAPDGELGVGGSYFENTQHYNLTFQALPWLETAFKYSGLQHFDRDFPVFYDRSFGIKARLWNEGDILPSVAVGINDLIGTGVYSGEYVVATKQFGPVDATLGMGWGRLATANTIKNPLRLVSSIFDNRVNDTTGVGQFTTGRYFRGPNAGIFGGAVWHTPIDNLSLVAEYSSDSYTLERARGTFTPRGQYNLGLSYQAFDSLSVGLNWLYGRSIGFNLALQMDPTKDVYSQRLGPPPLPIHERTPEEQQAALNRLVDTRNGTRIVRTRGSSGALVDALWDGIPALDTAAVRGRTLLVTLPGSNWRAACDAAMRAVIAYGANIDSIEVAQPGSRAQRCPAIPSPAVLTPALLVNRIDGSMLENAGLSEISPLTMDASPVTRQDALARIKADVGKQQITLEALSLTQSEVIIYYYNGHYFHEREAVDRLVRLLMADAPPEIESFRIISTQQGRAQREFDILRAPTERRASQSDNFGILDDGNSTTPAPLDNPVLAAAAHEAFPRFGWSISPQFRQQLFDPSNPFAIQFLAAADATVQLTPQISLFGEVEANIYSNFITGRPPDSVLPHVRTDFQRFFTQGKNGIGALEADYDFRLAPTVYAAIRGGYLESMFGGIGGEILWRPEGQRWALGADLYGVEERNFDRLFGFQSYRVITGHVAVYYASPWYDLNFSVLAGRYLAGDNGLTMQISRSFDTGVEIGVFATKTNVTAAQFGEGSFDKGIFIRIPVNWALPIPTQQQFGLDLRPVQRDGGQRLLGDIRLYDRTRRSSYGQVVGTTLNVN
jgi:hypothetical protein